MTKEELKDIVDTVHANWNIIPLPAQLQHTYRVWYSVIGQHDYQITRDVIQTLIKEDNWAPRAGTVHNRILKKLDPNPAPTPPLAWEQYRTLAKQLDTGIWEEQQLHPKLQQTINTIGGYHLHTNADREHFTQIYTELLNTDHQ